MSDWQPLLNILAGIPVAVLTAWLTVKLSLGRFRSEKWFERRLDSYTKVIEALHFMKHCTETEMRAEVQGHEIDEKAKTELLTSYAKGRSDLRRLTDMGALIFSPAAVALLDTLNSELLEALGAPSYWAPRRTGSIWTPRVQQFPNAFPRFAQLQSEISMLSAGPKQFIFWLTSS